MKIYGDRGKEKKKETAAAVAATEEEACRDEVAAEELSWMKLAKEYEKAPAE